MGRLTIQSLGDFYDTKNDDEETYEEIITKLGKIEDLEENLGCELKIIIKALMLGIYTKDGFVRPSLIWYYEWSLYDEETKKSYAPFEYGETWWFGEDNENEE